MSTPFLKRIWEKPPIMFPLVAVGHIVYFLLLSYSHVTDYVGGWLLAQPILLFVYTLAWLFCCDLKRWAALIYIALTSINLALRFWVTDSMALNNFTDVLFPMDVLFSFFLMYFFRNFD